MKLLKKDLCESCGKVTNERYRQMKMLNHKRWEQIQELEKENERLRNILEKK